jgi:hypothetical protein
MKKQLGVASAIMGRIGRGNDLGGRWWVAGESPAGAGAREEGRRSGREREAIRAERLAWLV